MWHAIVNWPWATIWAGVSAVFTASTVGVGGLALFQWSKQEKLRVKLDFKKSVGDYAFHLAKMPSVIFTQDLQKYEKERIELYSYYSACMHAWAMTEDLLNDNETVAKSWEELEEANIEYLAGKSDSAKLDKLCENILNEHFVFHK